MTNVLQTKDPKRIAKLQELLGTLTEASKANHAWIAFWDSPEGIDLDRALALARTLDLDRALARTLDLDRALDLARTLDLELARELALDLAFDLDLDRARDLDLDRARDLDLDVEDLLEHATFQVRAKLHEAAVTEDAQRGASQPNNALLRQQAATMRFQVIVRWFPNERYGPEDREEMVAIFRQGYHEHDGDTGWLIKDFGVTGFQAIREQWRVRHRWFARLRLS